MTRELAATRTKPVSDLDEPLPSFSARAFPEDALRVKGRRLIVFDLCIDTQTEATHIAAGDILPHVLELRLAQL